VLPPREIKNDLMQMKRDMCEHVRRKIQRLEDKMSVAKDQEGGNGKNDYEEWEKERERLMGEWEAYCRLLKEMEEDKRSPRRRKVAPSPSNNNGAGPSNSSSKKEEVEMSEEKKIEMLEEMTVKLKEMVLDQEEMAGMYEKWDGELINVVKQIKKGRDVFISERGDNEPGEREMMRDKIEDHQDEFKEIEGRLAEVAGKKDCKGKGKAAK